MPVINENQQVLPQLAVNEINEINEIDFSKKLNFPILGEFKKVKIVQVLQNDKSQQRPNNKRAFHIDENFERNSLQIQNLHGFLKTSEKFN